VLNLAPAGPLPGDALRALDLLVVNEHEAAWLGARLGEEEGIEPNGFAAFVRRNGGLAACATRAAEKRQNSAGGSREAGIAAAEALKARGLNAPKLQLPAGITLPKEGPIALLVEPGPKGLLSLLDYRRVSAGAVASSSPVSARLIKPAEGRRG
jgi:hypothetical protein